jgi:hypothetical protein
MLKQISILLVAFFSVFIAQAQVTMHAHEFGKNRIQHQKFDWKYISSENFEIYYYSGAEEISRLAAQYAEAEFYTLVNSVGYSPYNKVKIFLYQSISELEQSNLGVGDQNFEAIGGQTNFDKSVIEIAFTGDKARFGKDIKVEVANALLSEMMYGGNLKDVLRSSYFLHLPDWFISGAAAYIAGGWTNEMDDFVRANINTSKFKNPDVYKGENARLVGQSIWNYIAEQHGKQNIADILNLTRIIRNERNGIRNSLGGSYKDFIQKWKQFYEKQYQDLQKTHIESAQNEQITQNKKGFFYNHTKINPSGKYLAVSKNLRGKYKVLLQELDTQNPKFTKIFKGGYELINQKADLNIPLLAWKSDTKLGIISVEKGKYIFSTYDTESKQTTDKDFDYFENIYDFAFDSKGKKMILSAERQGQGDVYLYDLTSQTITQLTDDIFDYRGLCFLKNKDSQIVFSSNRLSDSLDKEIIKQSFNLFTFDVKTKKVLNQLTNGLSLNNMPLALDDNIILFVSDRRGIQHLYRHDLTTGVSNQISNFLHNIEQYDFQQGKLVMVKRQNRTKELFLKTDFDYKKNAFTAKTPRQQVADLRMVVELRKKKNSEEVEIENNETEIKDNNQEVVEEAYQFDELGNSTKEQAVKNNYDFFANPVDGNKEERFRKITGPLTHENRFSVDLTAFSIACDPLRGFGLVIQEGTTDALENNKINGGIFLQGLSLKNALVFLEYEHLKHRFDFRFRYDRQSYFYKQPFQPSPYSHNYILNRFEGEIAYPFSITSKVSLAPFVATTQFLATSETDPSVQQLPSNEVIYTGVKSEFVFDNTVRTGLNMQQGSKLQSTLEYYVGTNVSDKSFGNLNVDARHYMQIGRGVTFATRFTYGQFFGDAKDKLYRLGGVNGSLFSSTDVPETSPFYVDENDPNTYAKIDMSDILFLKYATPLRGFEYNKLRGNNYMVMNLEARVPLFQYFQRRTIRSNFFKNLQFVAFSDIGSAWTGISPFNRKNSLNTIDVGGLAGTPFSATVSNFKDPFLVGYGLGLRSKVLNYFTKFDVAWGLEDGQVNSAQFYFSFGYDF